MPGCVFCDIVAGDAEAFLVAGSPHAAAFLDIAPLSRGHTLVVPNWHVADVLEGGADVLTILAPLVQQVSQILVDRLGAEGINLLHSSGAAAGQEVFHFHLHVIPRWRGDGLLRGLTGERVDSEELDAVHRTLISR
jgi:histidine triad (HIT) family protein